ncbi:MAG: hypothetical protein SOY67_04375 [Collinsella sp.]|nr:hypothetical protein [Collinsella sp.]
MDESKEPQVQEPETGGAGTGPDLPEPAADGQGQRTFTQAEVDALMGRVRRETRGQFADYDELRERAARAAEADEARERAERAEAELAEARARIERQEALSRVSAETGVPANLIHGGDEVEMRAAAEALRGYIDSLRPAYPEDKGGSAGGRPVTDASIDSIANPLERVRARAKHADIYR